MAMPLIEAFLAEDRIPESLRHHKVFGQLCHSDVEFNLPLTAMERLAFLSFFQSDVGLVPLTWLLASFAQWVWFSAVSAPPPMLFEGRNRIVANKC